jgi:SAM-dependent methyltransferase
VRYLAAQGVDQYIDIGAGIPTQGNVHEILREVRPHARVAYVDIDPLAVAEGMDLLAGDERATAVRGDLRDPGPILEHPEVRRLLDLDQAVGLLLVAVLHFVPDDAVAHGAVELLRRALAPGSYLAASHGATERAPTDAYPSMERAYDQRTMTGSAKSRDRAEFARFFADWEMVDPGIVWLSEWRPDRGAPSDDPAVSGGWAAVARKP